MKLTVARTSQQNTGVFAYRAIASIFAIFLVYLLSRVKYIGFVSGLNHHGLMAPFDILYNVTQVVNFIIAAATAIFPYFAKSKETDIGRLYIQRTALAMKCVLQTIYSAYYLIPALNSLPLELKVMSTTGIGLCNICLIWSLNIVWDWLTSIGEDYLLYKGICMYRFMRMLWEPFRLINVIWLCLACIFTAYMNTAYCGISIFYAQPRINKGDRTSSITLPMRLGGTVSIGPLWWLIQQLNKYLTSYLNPTALPPIFINAIKFITNGLLLRLAYYLYSGMCKNPRDISNSILRNRGYIPFVAPGEDTHVYIQDVSEKMDTLYCGIWGIYFAINYFIPLPITEYLLLADNLFLLTLRVHESFFNLNNNYYI